MRGQKSFLITVLCLVLGFMATISQAQQAQDEFPPDEVGAGAKLVATSISGPATATHGQTISVTYRVKNQGTAASGAYQVDLYLSTDRTISPASERLLRNVTFSEGLASGDSRKATAKVLVPLNGLSGNYYYGAVVGSSKKASSEQVFLVRYSLGDNNDTVIDYETGLTWQQRDDGWIRNWADASQYCSDLVLGGKEDWRLPSIDELETIIDYSQYAPSIDPLFDLGHYTYEYFYWSSSTYPNYPDEAWVVLFYYGQVYACAKINYGYYARCVRGGP